MWCQGWTAGGSGKQDPTYNINKKGRIICFLSKPFLQKMLDYYVDRPDTLIIDLREPESYRKSHIRGAVNIPYEELSESPPLPKEKLLIFYCDRGGASMAAARDYVRRGYRTRSVIGGFGAYRGRNRTFSG